MANKKKRLADLPEAIHKKGNTGSSKATTKGPGGWGQEDKAWARSRDWAEERAQEAYAADPSVSLEEYRTSWGEYADDYYARGDFAAGVDSSLNYPVHKVENITSSNSEPSASSSGVVAAVGSDSQVSSESAKFS